METEQAYLLASKLVDIADNLKECSEKLRSAFVLSYGEEYDLEQSRNFLQAQNSINNAIYSVCEILSQEIASIVISEYCSY